jgi:hypothetical protein
MRRQRPRTDRSAALRRRALNLVKANSIGSRSGGYCGQVEKRRVCGLDAFTHPGGKKFRLGQLGAHVLLVQFLHDMPIQPQLLQHPASASTR